MHAQFGVPWVGVARSPVSQCTEQHERDSPTTWAMPQEVLSGLEPVDAHEVFVACGSP